MLQTLA